MLEQLGASNMHFFLAAIPVQLIILFFYMSRKQLPLRESRSFLALMLLNTFTLLLDLVIVTFTPVNGSTPAYVWRDLFFSAFYLEDYVLFYYFCDALRADEFGGRPARIVALVPALLSIGSLFLPPGTGSFETGTISFFRMVDNICLGFYCALSAILIGLRHRENSKRRTLGFTACLLILLFGIDFRYEHQDILLGAYFFTLSVFVMYLTVRNPDFYLDHQTGLLNRSAFHLVAGDRIHTCGIHGFGFVIQDYEEGRILYGGPFIDSFLANIGHYLQHQFRRGDVFYMGNGRYFILYTKPVDEKELSRAIHDRFSKPWVNGERSASFDIRCFFIEEGLRFKSVDELMQVITFAYGVALRPGQGDFTVRHDYQEKVKRQVYVRRRLLEALASDTLQVYLQPIMNGETEKPEGAEALVRLADVDGSIISPGEFIPAAESSGSVTVLGLQVFRKVCAFIQSGGFERCGLHWINVNVSPVQCLGRDLADRLEEIRLRYKVPRHDLHLEITEQGALGPGGYQQVEALHRRGYDIVLDDFGTGYSNASRGKAIPLSGVKIDISLVRAHFRHPDPYLPHLIRGFHDLGFTITAEGVETEEMVKGLRDMGCNFFQGFYYSRPIPMEEFVRKYGVK